MSLYSHTDSNPQTASAPSSNRCAVLLWIIAVLFVACFASPWLWFHNPIIANASTPGIQFKVHTNVNSWEFSSEPLTEAALRTLANPKHVNGSYRSADGQLIRLFFAEWQQSGRQHLGVLQHTPDVCWVSSGWVPVEAMSEARRLLNWAKHRLEFQCRTFASPNGKEHEVVIWCAVVGGGTMVELSPAKGDYHVQRSSSWRSFWARRRLDILFLWHALSNRGNQDKSIQFLRLSTRIGNLSPEAIDRAVNMVSRFVEEQAVVTAAEF